MQLGFLDEAIRWGNSDRGGSREEERALVALTAAYQRAGRDEATCGSRLS